MKLFEIAKPSTPPPSASVEAVLKAASAAVRKYGYRKSTGGYGGSTPHMVRLSVFGMAPMKNDPTYEWYETCTSPTKEDENTAEQLLNWFNGLPDDQKQDNFVHNVDVIVKSNSVTARDIGYLVALFPMYARAQGMIKQQSQQAQKANQHMGLEGHSLQPTDVTVVRTRYISGPYGTSQMCSMEDDIGNTYVWFNSGKQQLEQGEKYTITGTVKKHDEFKGVNQTHLTRVKATKR